MNQPCNVCSDEQLRSLLQMDDGEGHQDSADHLAECPHCQSRLEHMAAEPDQWHDIRDSLLPESEFDENTSSNGNRQRTDTQQRDRAHWKRPNAWTESMAKSLLSTASHPELLGRIGRYDVERLIGSGGMGVVFKAYDTELNRPVAVKLLAPYLASSGSARNRFAREARAAAAVVDDHVVPIHNVETDGEHPFLVMKFIAGGSLQQRIDREGPLEICEVLRIGMHTAKGLAAAHAQGLIHRDVKPSNILLDEGVDRALLTDFGLARATDDASLTRSGFHPGTPHYMSPEQVRGEAIDARSDLFGLGCVLYALCTGHPPFRSETSYAVLRRITDDIPRSIRETNPNVPEWLELIVMKLLNKSPVDRYASANEVQTLLERCLAHVQQPTAVELPAELQLKNTSRWWYAALAIAFLCIAVCCSAWCFNHRPAGVVNNAASTQTGEASISVEPDLQWESDANVLESLRQDFEPAELKTKKPWDIEPSNK
jgi:serine/threonine protein kinase